MMHIGIYTLSLVFLIGLTSLCGCSQPSEEIELKEPISQNDSDHEKVTASNSDLIRIKVSGIPVWVELAQTPKAQEQGLMFREHLPENQGMLFVYLHEQVLSFWMRNTFIPLDIAFIDREGVIVSIQQMTPLDEEKHYVSPVPVKYALEMNQGWFERNRVRVGDRVDF